MRILVAESADFSPEAAGLLSEVAEVTLADLDSRALVQTVPDYDAVWVRLRSRIDREIMAAGHRLRVIATPTTGLTHIDLEEADMRGIAVLALRGETEFLRTIRATSELTLALMLALLRNLPAAMVHAGEGNWDRDRFRGQELYGSTVGLVGFGRLGQLVARLLLAFDAKVLAFDPYVDATTVPPAVCLCSFERVLQESDLVSIHACLSPETSGLLGEKQLRMMRSGALLVNTARGELVDEAALLHALDDKHLAGAALDVIADEHTVTERHPLIEYARNHRNLLLTPHVGGCTKSSMERTEVFLARKVRNWIERQAGQN